MLPFDKLDEVISKLGTDGNQVYCAWETANHSTFKIGHTYGLGNRIHALALGNSNLSLWCSFPGSQELEARMKSRLWRWSVDHREIFLCSPDIQMWVEALVKQRHGIFYR